MSSNMNTFNAPAAAMLDMAAFNSFLVQPPSGMSNIRAPVMVARGAQWIEKHHWSMIGQYTPKAEKQPLVGLGLGWPVGQSFISFIQELETLIVDPHSLDFLITPPLPSSTWTCTTSALNPKATAFVPRLSVSASNPPALNPRAAWFVPRHTTKSLNPSVIEYIPSLTAFGLNPRATEFIPHAVCRPNTSLKEITPRRARFPRAPRMVTPCVSEETWDCAEFMDTRASYGSFEEFGAHSQTDELASGFDPVAEKFVPHWVDPSIEAQELGEPIHSEMMRTRITKRGPGRTLQPQASQETWDCAEFMDSLERYDSNEEAVARIQPDDCACHPSTLASEFVPHQIRRSDATLEDTPRSIPMSRSVAMFKAGILDPPPVETHQMSRDWLSPEATGGSRLRYA